MMIFATARKAPRASTIIGGLVRRVVVALVPLYDLQGQGEAHSPPARDPFLSHSDSLSSAPEVFKIIRGGYGLVVVATPAALRHLNDSATTRAIARCNQVIRGHENVGSAGWRTTFDSAAETRTLVVFSFVPNSPTFLPCDVGDTLLMRGIHVVTLSTPAYNSSWNVVIERNDSTVVPVIAGRARVGLIVSDSAPAPADTANQVWLAVALDTLSPNTRARFPRVGLRVTGRYTIETEIIGIPDSVLHAMWMAYLPWRVERLKVVGTAPPRLTALALPAPKDRALLAAHVQYESGDVLGAARSTLVRMTDTRGRSLSRDDLVEARMLVGAVLLAHGDSVAARVPLGDALVSAPCLTLHGSVEAEYREVVEEVRPVARCTVLPLRSVALRSLVPGLGQVATGRRRGGAAIGGLTGLLGGVAAISYWQAERKYAQYREANSTDVAVLRFDQASGLRRNARGSAIGAAALWVLSTIEAVFFEHAHSREVGRVRNYGFRSRIRTSLGRTVDSIAMIQTF